MEHVKRKFIYKGEEMPDPNEAYTIQEVLDFYSIQHPELLTASYEETEPGVFEFKTNLKQLG